MTSVSLALPSVVSGFVLICRRAAHHSRLSVSLPGLGHYNVSSVPTKLGGDVAGVSIIQVASYADCCLAVSDEGDVFGWGNSEYLQLACVTDTTQVCLGIFFSLYCIRLKGHLSISHPLLYPGVCGCSTELWDGIIFLPVTD